MKEKYLGQKGYSIYKSSISIKEQNFIRSELTFKPYIPKSPVEPESFPVYLESPDKLYVPRYFGINNFGIPDNIKIGKGIDTQLNFVGTPYDYQSKIANIFISYINKQTCGGGGLIDLPCGKGKTFIALLIASIINKKTLIIVHKEFLMNQWKERINQYIPNAKIGTIQGQILDIENKDIVIGMLQSLSMKEYPYEIFRDFGFLIVDECHHISAEVFVKALHKTVIYNTLGLSATMNRKDGLTKVFKLFLGDIIYKEKRDNNDDVLVKALKFKTDDEEYNSIEYDFRGNIKYTTMISKITKFNYRTEYIINIIKREIENDNKKQILLLSQTKNLLVYIHKAINHRNITDVGFYIGGMKPKDLDESSRKTLILATYQMAAEALDIKSLNTLILATPKTDIVQAVGRILRMKHQNPLVIDIVDEHDVFMRQYKKREKFYIQNKYKIIESDNINYFQDKYTDIYNPVIQTDKTDKTDKEKKTKNKCLISIDLT